MNPQEILRIVDAIHRDKNIDKEIVFEGIEAALVSAAKKHYGEEADIVVKIDREDGSIHATHEGRELDSEETVGRIGAQTAKQVMIQKIREAERDALFDEYTELIGHMVSGVIQRYEGGAASVQLANVEAILPDGTRQCMIQIPDYDFNWQGTYLYRTPLALPKGARVHIDAHYDNSTENLRNPNTPPKDVRYGEASTDEMCLALFGYVQK